MVKPSRLLQCKLSRDRSTGSFGDHRRVSYGFRFSKSAKRDATKRWWRSQFSISPQSALFRYADREYSINPEPARTIFLNRCPGWIGRAAAADWIWNAIFQPLCSRCIANQGFAKIWPGRAYCRLSQHSRSCACFRYRAAMRLL